MTSEQPDSTSVSLTDLGLAPVELLSASERAELDFLRYEAGHLQRRLGEVESEMRDAELRHNRMSQDFRWTLEKLASSPAGPFLNRRAGFKRMIDTWGAPPT